MTASSKPTRHTAASRRPTLPALTPAGSDIAAAVDLVALEARYRALVLATGQITWTARSDGNGGWAGDGREWRFFTGQDDKHAGDWSWLDALHPDDRERAAAAWNAAVVAKGIYEIDYRVRRHDGEYRWLLVRGAPVLEADGRVREWVGTATDITERKREEERLRASEAQLAGELADLQRLQRISGQLIQAGNLDALYQQILDAAIAVMRSDMASMQMLDGDQNELRLLAWKGFHPDSAAFWERVRVDSGSSCGVALSAGERVVVPDVETCEFMAGTEDLDFYRVSGIRAVQSTPLLARDGHIVGMISTHWRAPHQPSARALGLLDVLARQAADLIERKQAEQASARLAAIVTSAEDAIASKTLDGIVTSWNASAERMFGYTAQEMIGQSITRLFPADRLEEEDHILARLRAGEHIEHFETVRVTKNGRKLDVSLTISPIRDSTGAIIGASKITRDITERKRIERMLAEQNHLLEMVVAGRPLGECLAELTRAVARLEPQTRAAVALADRARTTIATLHAADLPPSFGAGLKDAPTVDRATGAAGMAIYRGQPVTCADIAHDERWSPTWRELCMAHSIPACHAEPVIGPTGRPIASLMLCFGTPRTPGDWELRIAQFGTHLASIAIERDHAAQAVRDSEEKFRTLADNIPTLAWMAHPDGRIFWYNRRWYEYTGTTIESQEGWGWQSVHDPDLLPGVMERWQQSIASGEPFEMVFPLRSADGVFRPFLTRIVSVKDEQGRVVRWFGTNTDITDQRAAEEALRAANQRMDEFLSTATHELKTPLAALQANLQLIERRLQRLLTSPSDKLPHASREALEPVAHFIVRNQQQVRRLTRLVNDMVDAARIHVGKLEIRPAPCDLAEIVWEAVTEQRAVRPERTIHLQLPEGASGGRPVPVEADADRIGQAVTNYLTNALKYSPTDRTVEVTLCMEGHTARVAVLDAGPGIPAAEQERVWERGHRVPGIEPSSEGVGLGLGLHISREIVERHGGKVGLDSAPGQGSTFWFTLPLASDATL